MFRSEDISVLMELHWSRDRTAQTSILAIDFCIFRSSGRHFLERSWVMVAFSSFTVVTFHELVCPPAVVLPQIFFSLTTPYSYPVSPCLLHAPLEVVIHFLLFFRPFMYESVLSQFLHNGLNRSLSSSGKRTPIHLTIYSPNHIVPHVTCSQPTTPTPPQHHHHNQKRQHRQQQNQIELLRQL